EYSLLYNRPLPEMELPARLRHVLNGPSNTHLWAQFRLPSIGRRECIDLLHSPGQGIPLLYDGPSVFTIHDLSPLLYPEQKELTSRIIWNSLVPIMARKADHIITVSNNTKQDVVNLLGIPDYKITTVYEAAGPEYFPVTDQERLKQFRKDKALEPGYILAVGTLEPRKNYSFLFQVFKRWLEKSCPDATLVIVGQKGWLYDEIFKTFERLNLRRNVRFEGYVRDMDVMRLYYSAAEFSILTPLYEGFWLPGLESMACGTPVIGPKHSSIAEIAGEGGFLVDSWEEDAWISVMDRLWKATDRNKISKKSIDWASKFSWEKAAQETLAVYRRVAQEAGL
ncbi:glycosyltransferase family 4 protein, partial [bacterium]|nr:glycosyltransferase family 4 protein [bacterium]